MIRICRQCRRSRRPIQLESRGAPEKLLAFRRPESPEPVAKRPGVIKIPTSTMTMWRYCPQCAALGWFVLFLGIWWIQWNFHLPKTASLRIFLSIFLPNLWWSKMLRTAFLNFLRQNQHFFSQKQTKILLDWLHEALVQLFLGLLMPGRNFPALIFASFDWKLC